MSSYYKPLFRTFGKRFDSSPKVSLHPLKPPIKKSITPDTDLRLTPSVIPQRIRIKLQPWPLRALPSLPVDTNRHLHPPEKLPVPQSPDSSPSTATSSIESTDARRKTKTTRKRHWNPSGPQPTSVPPEDSTPYPRVPPRRTSAVEPPTPTLLPLPTKNELRTGWQRSEIETSSSNPSKWITTKSERSSA